MERKEFYNWIFWIALFAVVLGSCFLKYKTLADRDLWNDEVFQYNSIKGEFKPFWEHNYYGDHTTFPGEYLLNYHVAKWFGMNKWGLAIPHILVNLLGFIFLYFFSKKFFKTRWTIIGVFLLFSLHKTLNYHALEFRPYAVLPVLAVGSFLCSYVVSYEYEKLNFMKKFFIVLFIFIATNYHAYGVLITALPFLYFFLCSSQKNKFPYVYVGALGLISISVMTLVKQGFFWVD